MNIARSTAAAIAVLLLIALPAAADAPAGEPALVTDGETLASMGFPRDATNVYMAKSVPALTPEDFGSGDNFSSVAAKAFIPRQDTTGSEATYNGGTEGCCTNLSRTGAGPEQFWDAPLDLPSGALIRGFTLFAFDTNATVGAELDFFTFQTCNAVAGGTSTTTTMTSGGTTGSGGGQAITVNLVTPLTVNNTNCHYTVRVAFRANTLLTLQSVRVRWARQVSPAPAVATFTDVPTGHPQFRFVEALVASGITGGCGAGIYCPDNPLTRGQMAVFLSVALGLRFQ